MQLTTQPDPERAPRSPAEIYDEQFVPALFTQWAPALVELAGIRPGQRVLDVACGTGALTCQLPEWVGSAGSVVGLDPSPEMLAVARRKAPGLSWIEARAEALPFPDGCFDSVVSQFGFMFFDDRAAALREMLRVLRPGGKLAIAVWDDLEHCTGYAALGRLLAELFEPAVAEAFRAPFRLGAPELLLAPFAEARIAGARAVQRVGSARFASLEALLRTERACVWTLGGLLDDAQFARLRARAEQALKPFAARNGALEFDCPALIASAARP